MSDQETITAAVGALPFPLRVRCWQDVAWDRFNLALVGYDNAPSARDSTRWIVTDVTLTQFQPADEIFGTTIPIDRHDDGVQRLMDELWQAGIRPTQVGTAGHVQAIEGERDHLRELVAKVLPSALRKP